MEVDEALAQLSGTATRRQLRRVVARRALQRAVAERTVLRVARGRFALAAAHEADVAASRHGGTVAGLSAAVANGWPVLFAPDRPWIAVPRHRSRVDQRRVRILYSDERETDPVRIVLQCAMRLPLAEALAVADSALRSGQVDVDELAAAAARRRGPGSAQARRVARLASSLKQSVLESALHAIVDGVRGLDVEPQVEIDVGERTVTVDFADLRRKLVFEAEGWLYHGSPESFEKDVRRYTLLVAHGWTVLRFTHHQVVHEPEWVLMVIQMVLSTGTTDPNGAHAA